VVVDFTCEYVNEVGAKLAGCTAEDLIGRLVTEVSPGSFTHGLFDRYREVAEGGRPWRQQFTSAVTAQAWEIKIVRVELGFVAVSYREVTEQVNHQEELERCGCREPRPRWSRPLTATAESCVPRGC
jgi:hypothetical protein